MQSCSCAANSEKARYPPLTEVLNSIQRAFRNEVFRSLPPPREQGPESMFFPNDPEVISSTYLANTAKRKPDIISVGIPVLEKAFKLGFDSDFDSWKTAIATNKKGAKADYKISWNDVHTILELKFSSKISSERLGESYDVPKHQDSKEDEATECDVGMADYCSHSMFSYETAQDFLRNVNSVLVNSIPQGRKLAVMVLLH